MYVFRQCEIGVRDQSDLQLLPYALRPVRSANG